MDKKKRTIKRRRKEGKTDYKVRLGLLKSGKSRIVVRKTNRYIIAQIVQSDIAQDKTLVSVNSKDLLKNGWPKDKTGSLKSLPAAYLTGYLLGKKSGKIKEGVFDIGLQRNVSNSRIYAFLKGLIDSGFKINVGEKTLPDEEFLQKNETSRRFVNAVKEKII